jgi:hypothetical protein
MDLSTITRNVVSSSSGPENKPRDKTFISYLLTRRLARVVKLDEIRSSESSVHVYQTTRLNMQEVLLLGDTAARA